MARPGVDWVLYSWTPLTLTAVNATFLGASAPLTGVLRLAALPPAFSASTLAGEQVAKLLDDHSGNYPFASGVQYTFDGGDETKEPSVGKVEFTWRTRGRDSLLMLAFSHQIKCMVPDGQQVVGPAGYLTLKGEMIFVVGSSWKMNIALPHPNFSMTEGSINDGEELQTIRGFLVKDANFTPKSSDPYFFGKEAARQARLLQIADELGEPQLRDDILDGLITALEPWMTGKNSDPFVYDTYWGGICSKIGLLGMFEMRDFGNGWFSDHHFHYGYIIYSAAVIGRFRPAFTEKYKELVNSLIRDIASPSFHDPFFPPTRHFSWFDSHSWASGVFELPGGKSQESVSEAINAYYAVRLYGLVTKQTWLRNFGTLMMAMEMQGAQFYWQMMSNSPVYDPVFRANKMNGQVASTTASYTTWFGTQVEYIHLINMIPFTPATEHFLSQDFIAEEYPVLKEKGLNRKEPPIEKRWRSYCAMALAIIDPKQAWADLVRLGDNVSDFDDGDSMAIALHWVATRD
eukprot:gb/GEZN01003863.1/.p1 GENE.gb/GEZN01003863.1/~~gb/GEZN01003863.1/.p1  ORF type:complete len:582 (+),score=79.46 gb/GEZN01003863.1/:200-1747(+)